jgi:SPP1 family predicted phage head-tail adaptor
MSEMILATRLTDRVRIEQPARINDGFGGVTVTWTELATVFADVRPMSMNSETMVADQVTARAAYRVTIRKNISVSASMRLVWRARMLSIIGVQETDQTLELHAREEAL